MRELWFGLSGFLLLLALLFYFRNTRPEAMPLPVRTRGSGLQEPIEKRVEQQLVADNEKMYEANVRQLQQDRAAGRINDEEFTRRLAVEKAGLEGRRESAQHPEWEPCSFQPKDTFDAEHNLIKIVLDLPRNCGQGGATNVFRRPKGDRATYKWHVSDWTVPQYTKFNIPALDAQNKPIELSGGAAVFHNLHDEKCDDCCEPAAGGGQDCTFTYQNTSNIRVEMPWPGGRITMTLLK